MTAKLPIGKKRNTRKTVLIICLATVLAVACIIAVLFWIQNASHSAPVARTAEEARIVATCGKWEIPYDELRLVASLYTADTAEDFRETVLSSLRNNYAVLAACDEYGVDYNASALSDAVQDKVDAVIAEDYGNDRSKYLSDLKSVGLTDALYRFMILTDLATNELYYTLRDDVGFVTLGGVRYDFYGNPTSAADYSEFYNSYLSVAGNMVPVEYLYIENNQGERPADNLALAESYRDELAALPTDERADRLCEILGTDTNCAYTGVGPFYIVKGTYTDAFWNGVSSLHSVGDLSDVIATANGYYVAVRVEVDEAGLLSSVSDLMTEYQSALVDGLIDEYKAELTVVLNEYGNSLDFQNLK